MIATLLTLFLIFAQLSLLSFGGGIAILPEMQRQVVEVHQWMTAQEFSSMFALAQAAPGPNMMVVPLVGWHVAGWSGVGVTILAMFGPSSLLAGVVVGLWERFKDRPWRRAVQDGLAPVTVGLFGASAIILTLASVQTWVLGIVCAASTYIMVRTRIHPLWVLAGGALIGLSGIGQG